MATSTRRTRKLSPTRLRKKLDASLMQLERNELIRRLTNDVADYIFKHALTQDAAYESLLLKNRREIHQRVAQCIEQLYPNRLDEFAAQLAQHYAEAGDDAKTLEYATRAGDVAAHVYANAEAIKHYSLALEAATRDGATHEQLLHLFAKRGRAYEVSADFTRALDNYAEMETVARARHDSSLQLQSLVLRATLHATGTPMFDPSQAQQLSDWALVLARELGDRTAEAKINWNLMLLGWFTGQAEAAIEHGEKALAIARELNLREQMAFTLNDLGGVYLQAGKVARVRPVLEEARDLWRALDNQPMLSDNLMTSAALSFLEGDFDQALLFTEEGAQISQKVGSTLSLLTNHGARVVFLIERGEFAQAIELSRENVRLAQAAHLFAVLGLGQSVLAWLFGTLGDYARARETARLARAILVEPIPLFFQTLILAYLARFYVLDGDRASAQAALQQRPVGKDASPIDPTRVVGTLAEGELALAQGDLVSAVGVMEQFIGTLEAHGIHAYRAEAMYLKAQGLRAQAKMAEALEVLQQARAEAEALGARRILWQILAVWSDLERQRGKRAESEKLRAQAREILEYILAHTPEEFHGSFLKLPMVHSVGAGLRPAPTQRRIDGRASVSNDTP